MSTTGSIARLIEQMANNQAQTAIQRGNINAGMIQSLANIPASVYGMKQDMEDRTLRRDSLKRAGEMQQIALHKAKKDEQDEKELKAILASIPEGPNAVGQRLQTFIQFWDTRDPSKAAEIRSALQNEAMTMAKLKEGGRGELPAEAALPATATSDVIPLEAQRRIPDSVIPSRFGGESVTMTHHTESELMRKALAMKAAEAKMRQMGQRPTVVQPGAAVIQPGERTPSFTQPAAARSSTAGVGRTARVGTRIKQFNTETGRYDIDVGPAPPREQSAAGAKSITPAQLNSVLSTMKNDLGKGPGEVLSAERIFWRRGSDERTGHGDVEGEEERIRREAAEKLAVYGLTLEEAMSRQGKATPNPVFSSQQPERPAAAVRPAISREEALAELRRRGVVR